MEITLMKFSALIEQYSVNVNESFLLVLALQ